MFKKIWSEESICWHIISRHGREPLNYYYYVKHYPDVHAAAERFFGGWKYAIEACGFDYSKIRKYQEWSRERVIEEIRDAYKRGKSLSSNYVQNNNKPLYMAAVKRFKSWGSAVRASGIDYKTIRLRRSMKPDEIKAEILKLAKKHEDLAYPHMRAKHQYLLAAAMKKLGNGSWAKAREVCGIKTNYRIPKRKRGKKVELEAV